MDRVNDIISEVDKNIKLFKLQMKRYKKHKKLLDKLKTNEILLSSLKMKSLISEEKPVLDSLKAKNSDQDNLVKEIDNWGANFEKLKNGKLDQRFFGAPTYRRPCYSGDYTGLSILKTLLKK